MQFGTVAVAVLVLTAVASQAGAQEKKLKRSDLPAAVQRSADEQSVGATVRGYSTEKENGQDVYEVEMTVHGHGRDVTIGADGTVLEIEEQVALKSLPAAVQAGLRQLAGYCRITKGEAMHQEGKLAVNAAQVW